MLLQTNSYIVPADKRLAHQRLIRHFRQVMVKLGCDTFEVYEQVGPNWGAADSNGRFVQIMRFRDRQHQRQVQTAERTDPAAQALIAEFCDMINLPYQQQQGLFAVGFYLSVVTPSPALHEAPASEKSPESGFTAGASEPLPETASAPPRQTDGDSIFEENPQEELTPQTGPTDSHLAPEAQPTAETDSPEPLSDLQDALSPDASPTNNEPMGQTHEEEHPRDLAFEEPPEELDIDAIAKGKFGDFRPSTDEREQNG